MSHDYFLPLAASGFTFVACRYVSAFKHSALLRENSALKIEINTLEKAIKAIVNEEIKTALNHVAETVKTSTDLLLDKAVQLHNQNVVNKVAFDSLSTKFVEFLAGHVVESAVEADL